MTKIGWVSLSNSDVTLVWCGRDEMRSDNMRYWYLKPFEGQRLCYEETPLKQWWEYVTQGVVLSIQIEILFTTYPFIYLIYFLKLNNVTVQIVYVDLTHFHITFVWVERKIWRLMRLARMILNIKYLSRQSRCRGQPTSFQTNHLLFDFYGFIIRSYFIQQYQYRNDLVLSVAALSHIEYIYPTVLEWHYIQESHGLAIKFNSFN